MSRYFVEYGALQERTKLGPRRVIECTTSALDAVKVPEEFARKIADALNTVEAPDRAAIADAARKEAQRCRAMFMNCVYVNEDVNKMLLEHADLFRKLARMIAGSDVEDKIFDAINTSLQKGD